MFPYVLVVLSALWVASEVTLAFKWRSGPGAVRKDAGTLKLLNLVIYGSIALAFVVRSSGYGWVSLPPAVLWSALAVIVAGLALKWWAVFSLRQFFTVDVAIQADHKIVRRGPYEHLRHPAYSGVLLSFVGLAICTSNWLSALIIIVPIGVVFLYRVRVEERALNEAFPQEYRLYSDQTSRLIPGVY